ncbi:MAG: NAD-dependent epimerase/dehydratase family protein [Chloroflexi bacterium]|nr:MAG: NAD-dependent epimerase/dehydratase family protein [Chloroflexota bacterium]
MVGECPEGRRVRALVTGGAGFIGHHLVRALVDRDAEVHVLDDLSTGEAARLAPVRQRITFVEGSVLDAAALDEAAAGCEVIFHLAAIPSVARSILAPMPSNNVNAGGTIETMLAAARAGVRRVVLAGSSSIYGGPDVLPCHEGLVPNPRSAYAASKLAAEGYLHAIGELNGIATVALRYFNVFGPGQDPASEYAAVVPRFITQALAGERPTINGTGDVTRDFTYVDNVVEANLRAASAPLAGPLTCNIGCGDRRSLLDLVRAIAEATGRPIEPLFGPVRAGDVRDSQADISRAREQLGYEVVVRFEEGIRRTVAWYRDAATAAAATSA